METYNKKLLCLMMGVLIGAALSILACEWSGKFDKNSECKKTDYWAEVEKCWENKGKVFVSEWNRTAKCEYPAKEYEFYSQYKK